MRQAKTAPPLGYPRRLTPPVLVGGVGLAKQRLEHRLLVVRISWAGVHHGVVVRGGAARSSSIRPSPICATPECSSRRFALVDSATAKARSCHLAVTGALLVAGLLGAIEDRALAASRAARAAAGSARAISESPRLGPVCAASE